jgi:alanine racemase
VSAPYRSYVLVYREQIARNHRAVRAVVGPRVEVAAVVKADAYGHDALEVSRIVTAEGAKWLAVAYGIRLTPSSIRFSKGVKGRIMSDR